MRVRKGFDYRYITLEYQCDVRFTPNGNSVCIIQAVDDETQYRMWKDDPTRFGELPNLLAGQIIKVYGKEIEREYKTRSREVRVIKEFHIFRWEKVSN
jgi:hypothetical protein